MSVKGYEKDNYYEFVVTNHDNTYIYQFPKEHHDMDTGDYLKNCKDECIALAQYEINKNDSAEDRVI